MLTTPPRAGLDLPTGTVTFYTDLEARRRLSEQHPVAMRAAVDRRPCHLRDTIAAHRGYAFRTVRNGLCIWDLRRVCAPGPGAHAIKMCVRRSIR